MEDSKIITYLTSRGIDPSVPLLNLNEEVLGDIKQHDVYTETSFDMLRIRNQIKGQKKEMVMRNCIIENTNARALAVDGKCIFYNCIFNNVKFTTCTLLSACFYHCSFTNASMIDSTLKSAVMINCDGLDTVDFVRNNMDSMKIIGCELDISLLEDHENKIEGIYVRKEKFMSEETVEEEKKEEEEMNPRKIIEKQTFKDKSFGLDDLKNTLFNECIFESCTFDKDIHLEASTDFMKCSFKKMDFEMSVVQKVIFDHSAFEDVFMASNFMHCSFVGCKFTDISYSDDVTFNACNFNLSNASEVLDIQMQHVLNTEFHKVEVKVDEELNNALQDLYMVLSNRDHDLQRKLKLLERDGVTKDIMIDYMLHLDDRKYIEFITDVGSKRKGDDDE